jgi:hypothetical protein
VLVLLVDGTDRGNAYGEAAATLGDDPSRRWSRPRSCPGWGSRVLWPVAGPTGVEVLRGHCPDAAVLLRCTGGGQAGSANVDQDGPIWPAQ